MESEKVEFEKVVFFQEGPGVRNWQFRDSGIKLINIKNIIEDKLCLNNTSNYLDVEEVEKKYSHFLLNEGEFVMASSGVTWGKIAEINKEHLPLCLNTSIIRLVPRDRNVLNKWYMYYFVKSPQFRNQVERLITGSAQPNFGPSHLKKVFIKVPAIMVQQEIINQIIRVENIIKKRKMELEHLDNLIKSRFVEVFGDPETNPYGWEHITVGDVCSSVVRGPFGSALKKEFFVEPNDTTYKVYEQKHAIQKSATIGTYYVTAEKFEELRRFECVAGDILMSCSGTMGELYQLPQGCEKGLINQALCKFTLNDKILPIVFLTYMSQTIGNLETKGSGIQNIAAVSYVKAMPINLPPLDVQKQFAIFVTQVDKLKLAS